MPKSSLHGDPGPEARMVPAGWEGMTEDTGGVVQPHPPLESGPLKPLDLLKVTKPSIVNQCSKLVGRNRKSPAKKPAKKKSPVKKAIVKKAPAKKAPAKKKAASEKK